MTDYNELLERLEAEQILRIDKYSKTTMRRNPDGPEAATAIRTLLAEHQAERAATVAWLRGQSEAGDKALLNAVEGSQLRRDLAAGVVAINRAANAIEAGQHLKHAETD